jgi:hypothetical protein
MGQINFIEGLIGEKISWEPNLGLIENIKILGDQM